MYVARTGLEEVSVSVSVMVVTSVVAGLSSECQPQLSTRLQLTVNFCSNQDCDDIAPEDAPDDDRDYDAEYVTNCDSEWGCESAPDPGDDDCGEWGCVTDAGVYGSRTAVEDSTEIQVIKEDEEMNVDDTDDVVSVIYRALMSDTMTPITITVLIIIGVLLLAAMIFLVFRGQIRRRCCKRYSYYAVGI